MRSADAALADGRVSAAVGGDIASPEATQAQRLCASQGAHEGEQAKGGGPGPKHEDVSTTAGNVAGIAAAKRAPKGAFAKVAAAAKPKGAPKRTRDGDTLAGHQSGGHPERD